jgi:hypothetical protein
MLLFNGSPVSVDVTENFFAGVYEILARVVGASWDDRLQFIQDMSSDTDHRAWCFCGLLGFGGKFRARNQHHYTEHLVNACPFYVDCYPEDQDSDILVLIHEANLQIAKLHRETMEKLSK